MADAPVYGILAQFATAEELVAAARRTREAGYTELDAFTPFPVEEIYEVLGLREQRVPRLGLIGGIFGAALALSMQAYVNYDFPLNVGGRPQYSWPAFAVVTFELTILFAVLFPAFGMLWLNRLPRLYHPVFNLSRFSRASKDRFFLCIKAKDPSFERSESTRFMSGLGAEAVELVPL